jgi:hypothetical protein
MTELPGLLDRVVKSAQRVQALGDELADAREELSRALIAAHQAGASFGMLGKMAGLSRQRVAKIVGG